MEWVDSSGPLFFMYSKMAEEEDKKMADTWHREADGILIFVSFTFHTFIHFQFKLLYRVVFSLPQLRNWSR
jgi:hypothetical protein